MCGVDVVDVCGVWCVVVCGTGGRREGVEGGGGREEGGGGVLLQYSAGDKHKSIPQFCTLKTVASLISIRFKMQIHVHGFCVGNWLQDSFLLVSQVIFTCWL